MPASGDRRTSRCCTVEGIFGTLARHAAATAVAQYMDLIARLVPKETSAFWQSLAQDFRCRYIVFEFRNYTEEISQNQIYTTEKYLYPTALRPAAPRCSPNRYCIESQHNFSNVRELPRPGAVL